MLPTSFDSVAYPGEILPEPPAFLLEGDECTDDPSGNGQEKTHRKEQDVLDGYRSLHEKTKKAADALEGEIDIAVRRDNIIEDLISAYRGHDITNTRARVTLVGEDASGNGVAREMYALFWDKLLSENAEGDSEFTVPNVITLSTDDYVTMGKILTHQFIQFGTFPVRLNQASMHQAIFGHVSNECLISSFLHLLPPRERECLSNALAGKGPFLADEVLEVLEDYAIRQMPSQDNIHTIILQVAKNELIVKPYMCLVNIRKGMASFWDDVTTEEVKALYQLSQPTPQRIISSLVCTPSDAKEVIILRWLNRYLKASSESILSHFLRFCTGTDVVVPDREISVRMETMPPTAMRPMAQTCFGILRIPKNYESFSQMRANLDLYFTDTSVWDMKDTI